MRSPNQQVPYSLIILTLIAVSFAVYVYTRPQYAKPELSQLLPQPLHTVLNTVSSRKSIDNSNRGRETAVLNDVVFSISNSKRRKHIQNINNSERDTIAGHDQLSPLPRHVHTSKDARETKKHGYILTLTYTGQQGIGVRSLASQQCWIGSFNLPMYIVEPFFDNSAMGSKPKHNTTIVPLFRDYFDIAYYNRESVKNGFAQLSTWEDFLDNVPKNVILVQMIWRWQWNAQEHKSNTTEIIWEATVSTPCYTSPNQSLDDTFCIIKVIGIPHTAAQNEICTAKEMYDVIFGKWSPDEVTLIFTMWRQPWFVLNPGHRLVCGPRTKIGDKLRPSNQLLKQAETYMKLYMGSKHPVAVMLRAEHAVRVVTFRKSLNLTIDICLQKVLDLVHKIQKKSISTEVFTTADVGKFESYTWDLIFRDVHYNSQQKAHTFQAVKDTVVALYKNKLTFEEWEESFSEATGGIQDRGYIAALQRTIASRADCLILMGGGNFQGLALQEYLHNHPDKSKQCFHMVCEEKIGRPGKSGIVI